MTPKKICIVVPTRNEEASIQSVIEDATNEVNRLGHRICGFIVTDDSNDKTRKIAKENGATVVIGGGKGLGHAMWKGLKQATKFNPDIIVSMDGDGQSQLAELEKFLDPILKDEADFVLGSRFLSKDLIKYKYPFINRTGIRILVWILRRSTKLPITDSHGGLRAMIPEVAKELQMIGTHTYVQETIIDAREKGFRIKEVPSVWEKRESGSSKVVSSIPLYIAYTLPVLILRSGQHIKLLYALATFFSLLAISDFLIVGIQSRFSLQTLLDRQSFHIILMLLIIAFNMFFFGFVLEILSSIKRRLDTFSRLDI